MPHLLKSLVLVVLSLSALLGATAASAQSMPDPPSTFVGSITDAGGEVPAGVKIEAYVGNNLCGESTTQFTGEGSARVTVYVVDIVSDSQIDGCGESGDAVRIRVGDRVSPKFTAWEAGLVRFDIVFGENITPKPIPTATATPTAVATATSTASVTPDSSVTSAANRTPTSARGTPSPTPTKTSTGVTSSTPAPPSAGDDSGGGFPVWGTVLLALIGLGLVGAGAGIYIARQSASSAAPG